MGGEVALCLLALLSACARIAPPPGGPPDLKPPVIVSTVPESTAVLPDFKGDVEFIFDETVSEGTSADFGLGTGSLERLVLLSPTTKQPVVRWHRGMISVRPKEGWKPGRVYRAELLPGVADLRRNVMKQGNVITFTTGAPLPDVTLRGTTIDWVGGRAAPVAMVEAVLAPDSLVYRSASDSTGRFSFGPLPRGRYHIYAYIDQNHDLKRAYREPWDSVSIVADRDSVNVPPFWMAPRDTTPPRFVEPQVTDSQTVTLGLNQPLDPYIDFDSVTVRLLALPDSTPVTVASLLPKRIDDSLRARARAVADSIRADSIAKAHPDTGRKKAALPPAPPAQPAPSLLAGLRGRPRVDSAMIKLIATRPPLTDRLVLRTATPLKVQGKYVIEVTGIRNVNRVGGRIVGGIVVPKPPPPPKRPAIDSTKADSTKADSTRKLRPGAALPTPPDSTAERLDSLKRHLRARPVPPPADSTKP
ncbi:MAG TPA: Ig-like domain-containing protein [Gemmatimonadales bacterium]|nr:Ig-like domain-containing protein [Gemmatimonadales bacterium]